ncbi:MAG: hypothetical protein HYZ54_01590 [Ignavibacteriae bacterium]|nr:hypothetical protein [Ignavibacteriota bacterium]
MDFVQTVGRMYYEQNNHANLADKKIQYFLEHIRTVYFVKTNEFTEEFLNMVAGKSGVDIVNVRSLFLAIENTGNKEVISEDELVVLHRQIASLYEESSTERTLIGDGVIED